MNDTTVRINGKEIEAVWHGPPLGAAPVLVFLHEGLGCVKLWRDFPERLSAATGCSAFVYSRIGYGRSSPCDLPRPVSFMHEEGLVYLPGILKQVGIEEHILVGHSDGGSIALIYGGGTPAKGLLGMITEAAHVYTEEFNLKTIRLARENYLNDNLREKLKKYHGDNVDCAFWGWNGAWLHPEFVHWNIEGYLSKITAPVLAVQGEQDPYGTAAQIESIVEKTGGEAEKLMLSNCRHSPHFDQPEKTLTAMTAFIRRIVGST